MGEIYEIIAVAVAVAVELRGRIRVVVLDIIVKETLDDNIVAFAAASYNTHGLFYMLRTDVDLPRHPLAAQYLLARRTGGGGATGHPRDEFLQADGDVDGNAGDDADADAVAVADDADADADAAFTERPVFT